MDLFKKGWYSEVSEDFAGIAQSYEVESQLAHEKSPFQDIEVFKTKRCGVTMAIDGAINLLKWTNLPITK